VEKEKRRRKEKKGEERRRKEKKGNINFTSIYNKVRLTENEERTTKKL